MSAAGAAGDPYFVPVKTTTTTTSAGNWTYDPSQSLAPTQWQFPPLTSTAPVTHFSFTTPLETVCLSAGHEMGDEIDLTDGNFLAFCDRCGARFVLKSIPGGMSLQRIKGLLADLAAEPELSEEMLLLFAELKLQLQEEIEALSVAASLLEHAEVIVNVKGLHRDVDPETH